MASKNFSQVDKAGAAGIWQHFLKEKQGQSAKCINCQAELKTTGGSTKGLHEHMKRVHNISTLKRKGGDDSDDKSKLDCQKAAFKSILCCYLHVLDLDYRPTPKHV
jgi:hypothetical protein